MTGSDIQTCLAPPAAESPNAEARHSGPGSLRSAVLFALVAILIAIPCVWQPHIQSEDLPSHLYNAWLVNDVSAGHLTGLDVVPQFTNVLFDRMLSFLLKTTGSVVATERIAVTIAVQIFFWGCFAFVSAVARRRVWWMIPFLLMLSYGAVFRLGFFNFYLSVGICAWAMALVWQNRPRMRWLAIPLLLLAFTAHSLPCVWAVAVCAYVLVARRLRPERRPWLMAAALLAVAALALFIALRMPSLWAPGVRIDSLLGADQTLTFGAKYKIVASLLLCLWLFLLIRRFEMRSPFRETAFQLWVIGLFACLLLPDSIHSSLYVGSLSYITIRLSLLSAILLCALISVHPIGRFARIASVTLTLVFFSFTFIDERALNALEDQAGRAVRSLPPGSRVISTLRDRHLYVQALEHIADRPCIGHCFDFGNYEPSTGQFRLRAHSGNTYVVSNYNEIADFEHDRFTFSRTDTDLFRLTRDTAGRFTLGLVKPGEQLPKQNVAVLSTRLDQLLSSEEMK